MEDQKISGKTLWDKKCQTYNWVHFVLAISCWEWRLTLRVACIPRETTLEKRSFSFSSSWQSERASALGMWIKSTSPLNPDNPSGLTCAGLYILFMFLWSLWVHLVVSSVLSRRSCFLGILHPLWLLQSFCLFLWIPPWKLMGGFWWRFLIKDWAFQGLSYSLHIAQLWVSVFFPSTEREAALYSCISIHSTLKLTMYGVVDLAQW